MWKSVKIHDTQYQQISEIQNKLQEKSVGTVHFYDTIEYLLKSSSIVVGGTI